MNGDGNKPETIFDLIEKLFKELPFHKRFRGLETLISDEVNDALSDLSEEDANILTVYFALNKHYDNNLQALEYMLRKKMSLMRSRERLGRQEYLKGLGESKDVVIPYQPIPHQIEIKEEEEKKRKGVILQNIGRIFRRR